MTQPEVRSAHPYFMYDSILEQPSAVAGMMQTHRDAAGELGRRLAGVRRLYLVGIGTSWHAALIAEHWFRHFAQGTTEVQAWHSFEFVAYPPPLGPGTAVIVISHRGTKTRSYQALELARERGSLTVAITSTNPGPRLQGSDVTLSTVEQERSAAFTVSYTAALAVMGMLAAYLGSAKGSPSSMADLDGLEKAVPLAMERAIGRREMIEDLVGRQGTVDRFLFTGWGPNTANAYEAALKMKETSFTSTEGFQVEQLLHGPFVATTESCLLTLIAPPGFGYERSLDIAMAARELDAPVWALVEDGDQELSALATDSFALPSVPELWSPLVYVIPLQLFTYYTALAGGCNPDLFHQDSPRHAAARGHYSL